MLSPEVCQFLTYWRSLGGGYRVPERTLLDLRQLTQILPWMFILEMAADGAMRYRLAGSALEGAVGRGMAGETHNSVFAEFEQAAVLEELYAVALVQGCGVLKTGSFTLASTTSQALEFITLPFSDPRAMGGIIFVGIIRPFEYHNVDFDDKWGELSEEINRLFVVPSPRIVRLSQLSERVTSSFQEMDVKLRVLNLKKVIEIDGLGVHHQYSEIPSFNIDTFEETSSGILN